MKKLLLICTAALILFSGCTNEKRTEKVSNRSITLTVMCPKKYAKMYNKCIKMYEDEHTNIRINCVELNGGDDKIYDMYSAPLYAGQDYIDIFLIDSVWTAGFAEKGFIDELSENGEKFDETAYDMCVWNGKCYALPIFMETDCIYYRRDLIENPPKSFDEWQNVCEKAVAEGKAEIPYLMYSGDDEESLLKFYEFKLAENENALEKYMQWAKYSAEDDGETVIKKFKMGKAAAMIESTFTKNRLKTDDSLVGLSTAAALLPKDQNGEETSVLKTLALSLNKHGKNKKEAKRFMEYMTSADIQKYAATEWNAIPAVPQVYEDYRIIEDNPYLAEINENPALLRKRESSADYMQKSAENRELFKKMKKGEQAEMLEIYIQ